MTFIINPYVGTGVIDFLMQRVKIRSILKSISSFEQFYRTDQSKASSDIFRNLGLIVNYDENDLCNSIEFYEPANLVYNGLSLLNMSYNSIFNYFRNKDNQLEEDDSGFISYKFGIGIYAPDKTDAPFEKIESIIVFKKDYYS